MAVTVAGLPFQFCLQDSASGATGFFFKSTKDAYVFDAIAQSLTKISDADYPATTVPGVAYLDGYFFVMDGNGTIYNCGLETPTDWNSLDYISCESEPDGGVAIAKYQNYIVGFGNWTTEFFYDAGNATGSPLANIKNASFQIGCANGYSVAQFDDKIVWMGNCREKGRGVYAIAGGMVPAKVSTPDIDRILNADSLATVYAWGAGFSGHTLYVLTLVSSGITLVYDFSTQAWSHFTRRAAGSAKSITSLTQINGIATAVCAAHGFADADPVTISGATPAGYNAATNIGYIDANTFSFECDGALTTPASGTILATGSTESYFNLAAYINAGGKDIVQGASDAVLYEMLGTAYDDNGIPIDAAIRTTIYDGGSSKRKFVASAEVIGDKVAASAFLRYSDDDYTTNSNYRKIDLSARRSRLSRLGSTSRRSFEIRHTASTPFRVEALEI